MEFEVVQGDITEQRADALVNEKPRMDSISEALSNSVEDELQENASQESDPILGEPVETSAPGVDAKYVIHIKTVGRSYHPNRTAPYTGYVLSEADNLGCKSVVLPIIYSTYDDVEPCAGMMFREIYDFESGVLADVRVIIPNEWGYRTAKQVAEEVREEKKGKDS